MCWHKWSKWELIDKSIGYNIFGHCLGIFYTQTRHCIKCYKTQIEKIKG